MNSNIAINDQLQQEKWACFQHPCFFLNAAFTAGFWALWGIAFIDMNKQDTTWTTTPILNQNQTCGSLYGGDCHSAKFTPQTPECSNLCDGLAHGMMLAGLIGGIATSACLAIFILKSCIQSFASKKNKTENNSDLEAGNYNSLRR